MFLDEMKGDIDPKRPWFAGKNLTWTLISVALLLNQPHWMNMNASTTIPCDKMIQNVDMAQAWDKK